MVAICVLPPVSLFTKVLFLSPVSTMITDNVNDGEDGMNPAEWVCAILNNCGSLSKVANEEIGEDSFGNKDYCEALKCFHTSLSILSKKTEAKYLEDFMPLNYNIALTLERVYSVVDQK